MFNKKTKDDKKDFQNQIEQEKNPSITRNSMAKGALILTLLSNFTTIADFLVVIYASTILTLENVGLYNLLNQYVPILTILIGFGMTNTVTKLITSHDIKHEKNISSGIVYKITLLNCLFGILFSIFFIIFSANLSTLLTTTPNYAFYMKLIGIQLIFIPNTIFNQFFVVRFKFKVYMITNLIGNLLRIVVFIFILNRTHDISAYFYSTMIGQGFKFIFLLFAIFFTFKKPDFSYSFKKIIKYSFPLFIGRFILYFKQWAYFIILNFVLIYQSGANIALLQIGLLSYIKMIFNIVNVSFNSLNNVLTVYYSTILNEPDSSKKYQDLTYGLSRFFQILSFIIGFGFMIIAPLYVKFITTIFHYDDLFSIGTLTMILYGIYFLLSSYYYICPTVINIHKTSKTLLIIHLKSAIIYLAGYFIFIWFFGMIGIPIAQCVGFVSFLWLCKQDISKKLKIGFNVNSLKKISSSIIVAIIIIPILYIFTKLDTKIIIFTALSLNISIPIYSIIINGFGIILGFSIFFIVIRHLKVFNESDKKFFNQLFGKNLGKILFKVFVKNIPKKSKTM